MIDLITPDCFSHLKIFKRMIPYYKCTYIHLYDSILKQPWSVCLFGWVFFFLLNNFFFVGEGVCVLFVNLYTKILSQYLCAEKQLRYMSAAAWENIIVHDIDTCILIHECAVLGGLLGNVLIEKLKHYLLCFLSSSEIFTFIFIVSYSLFFKSSTKLLRNCIFFQLVIQYSKSIFQNISFVLKTSSYCLPVQF